jgi:hypothetical protein
MKPSAKGGLALCCIDEDIGVGGSCHHRKGVVFFSSRRKLKFLHAKKEAQEAFDAKINWSD